MKILQITVLTFILFCCACGAEMGDFAKMPQAEEQALESPHTYTWAKDGAVASDEAAPITTQGEDDYSYTVDAKDDVGGSNRSTVGNTEKKRSIQEKIIKTAELSIEVADYEKIKPSIYLAIKKWEGYISSENETNDNYRIANEIVIRVPNKNFNKLVAALVKGDHKINYKRINATDVSEEYYDILTRLKTKKEIEKRYIAFLQKARNIEEVLMVEDKIRVIREEIEAREGRLKFLQNRVSYSTVTLEVYQIIDYVYTPSAEPGFFQRVSKALHFGWKGLLNFCIGLVYLWPLFLIVAVGLFILRTFLRRRKRKKQQSQ